MSPPQQREHALTSGRYRLIRRQRAELHKEPLSYEFVHLATRSYK
jgi:hypothetical protein